MQTLPPQPGHGLMPPARTTLGGATPQPSSGTAVHSVSSSARTAAPPSLTLPAAHSQLSDLWRRTGAPNSNFSALWHPTSRPASSCIDSGPPAVVPMITDWRSGSSVTMSLLGESHQVLPLFEVFNNFAHLDVYARASGRPELTDQLFGFLKAARFGCHQPVCNESTFSSPSLSASAGQYPDEFVSKIRAFAQRDHKQFVTFKVFGTNPPNVVMPRSGANLLNDRIFSMLEHVASDPGNAILVLSRNVFQKEVSQVEIGACTGKGDAYVGRDNSACVVALPLKTAEERWRKEADALARQRWLLMHAKARLAIVRYEELRQLKTSEQKIALLASRLSRATDGRFCAYRPRGWSDESYNVQDTRTTLRSRISNYAELAAWFTVQRRQELCTEVNRALPPKFRPSVGSAAEIAAIRGCMSNPQLNLPP